MSSPEGEEKPNVVIAGAGIGGLTTALALARTGFRVTLIEQADALEELGAGLQLSPNATRVLGRLGILDRVAADALEPESLKIRRGRDGHVLARVPLGAVARTRWGSPSLVVHRGDLQRSLEDAIAALPGVTLRLGTTVLGFTDKPGGVEVTARGAMGEIRLGADLLVGADGLHSIVRDLLNRDARDRLRRSGRVAWRARIAGDRAPPWALRPETHLWLGAGAHLVHYPLRQGKMVNVVAVLKSEPEGDANGAGEAGMVLPRFAGWHADVLRLLAVAEEWRVWPLLERPPLSRWSAGAVTLLGDAAHPMAPFLAQGAAQAIEDADALAGALSRFPRDIGAALTAYQKRRVERANAVQRQSKRQGAIYHLAGPAALARDLVMQALSPKQLIGRYDWIYKA